MGLGAGEAALSPRPCGSPEISGFHRFFQKRSREGKEKLLLA